MARFYPVAGGRPVLAILTSFLVFGLTPAMSDKTFGAVADAGATARPVLEEIIVTARKREESLLDIPESVVAISGMDIERQNLRGLDDIGILIPNLNLSRRTDGYPNVSIRGLGSFGNTQGVGFYLDDVQIFSDASSRFGDLDRIEVLKGPQGTLYGGSNIGGGVKFVSARPDPEALFGRVRGQVGDQSLVDVEGSVNAPLGDSGWALRLFGFYLEDDGFHRNPNPPRLNGVRGNNDRDVGQMEEYGVRVMLAGPLTERLSAFASLRYNELDGPNDLWIRDITESLSHSNVVAASTNPRHDRDTIAGMLELTLELNSWDLVSLTSYTDTDSTRTTDLDIREEFLLGLHRPETMKVFTQEIRLTSTHDAPLQWIVGAYYSLFEETMRSNLIWYDVREDADGNFSGTLGCALEMPTCSGVWAGEPVTPQQEQDFVLTPFELRNRDKTHLAAFVNATYRWTDWELGLGARVDQWENESENLDSGIASDQKKTEFLPRVSLVRWLPGGSMAYATYSVGYEPGGFNLANLEGVNDLFGFDAEKATSYELGWKGLVMDGRLQASVAAFYIDYEDRQVEFQVESGGSVIEGIVNIGDSEHYGLEGELSFQATPSVQLSAAAGWVDAEWRNGTIVLGEDLGGQTPPNVQDFSWTLAADYERPIGRGDMKLLGGVQVAHSGEFEGLQAWDPVTNPDYTVINAQLGIGTEQWELMMHVKNLTDEGYYLDVQRFPNFYLLDGDENIIIGTLGQPRIFSVSFNYRF